MCMALLLFSAHLDLLRGSFPFIQSCHLVTDVNAFLFSAALIKWPAYRVVPWQPDCKPQ
jgi:hypothetical protein